MIVNTEKFGIKCPKTGEVLLNKLGCEDCELREIPVGNGYYNPCNKYVKLSWAILLDRAIITSMGVYPSPR